MNALETLSSNPTFEKVLARAPAVVAIILVLLIGLQLSSIVFSFFGGNSATKIDTVASVSSRQSSKVEKINPATIVNAHIFGNADARDAPQPKAVVDTPVVGKTNLNIKLKGTIAANDKILARAIIADAANKEQVYAVEDTVANGVTLHAVERERVILNQSGRLTALELPKEFASGGRATPRRTSAVRAGASGARTNNSAAPSVRETLTQNVSKLTDVIRPQPYFSGGKQKGYRIYPGRDRKQFAALGLRPGDLVTEINGTPMTDPRQGMEVFRSLGEASSVSVTIERNGQPQTLTLSTSQLNQ